MKHNRAINETFQKMGEIVGLTVAQKRALAEGTSNSSTDESSTTKRQRINGASDWSCGEISKGNKRRHRTPDPSKTISVQ